MSKAIQKITYYYSRIITELKHFFVKIGTYSNFFARCYYFLISKSFERENRAVLCGKLISQKCLRKRKLTEYAFRRNIHRLEKGLIMHEKKDVFALSYITETVNTYIDLIQNPVHDKNLKLWAEDVLSEYFKNIKTEGVIKDAKILFESNNIERDAKFVPFERSKTINSNVNYYDFLVLCKQRVSTRVFKNKEVPRDMLEKAFEAALQSPSACNRQPYEFFVYQNKESIQRLIKLPGGITGFDKGVPAMAFLIGDLSAFNDERDRHLIYVDGGIIAMTFMLALETLGLASCALNMPAIRKNEKEVEKELKLPKHKSCIMAFIIGYPEEKSLIPYSQKKSISTAVKFKS